MKRPLDKLLLKIIFCSLILWIIGATSYFLFASIIKSKQGYTYLVPHGTSLQKVIRELSAAHIITHPLLFKILTEIVGNPAALKSGEYFFPQGTSSLALLNQIETGKGILYHPFTIVPGWTFQQLQEALQKEPLLTHQLNEIGLMEQLGLVGISPEGQFFPDTYFFIRDSSDLSILKRAHQKMQEKLSQAYVYRIPGLPYANDYAVLIAASLVEKEAYRKEERPLIASVLVNRLQKGMLLQFDPTVIYGMGAAFSGKLSKKDLSYPSPFNTYLHKGLPPAPIAIPGLDSITAVLHPANTGFLYFVARGDGSHQFSFTLVEHHEAVRQRESLRDVYFKKSPLIPLFQRGK